MHRARRRTAFCGCGRTHQPCEARLAIPRSCDRSVPGLCKCARRSGGRSLLWMADRGTRVSPRFEDVWIGQWPATYLNVLNSSRHFLSMWHQESGARVFERTFGTSKPRMRFVEHHLAHAISAYGYSGFDDAAIVIMDGRGAWEATSIWHGKNGRIEHVQTIPFPNSIGGFYSAFTEYLGFVPNSDEWKVMGLAPYGEPGVNLDAFITPETMNGTPYHVHTKRIHGGGGGGVGGAG